MQSDEVFTADALPADEGVDSLDVLADVDLPKQASTADTTMALFAVPWALCTMCLIAVILYVNVHNFSVDGALAAATQAESVAGAVSTSHGDTARYVLLAVSVVAFLLHLGLSLLLFFRAYCILLRVSASFVHLSLMFEMLRNLRCGIFFYVDSVQRARCLAECERYWVMPFSPFREVNAVEEALNAVSLRMSAQQDDVGRQTVGNEGSVPTSHTSPSISSSFQRSFLRSLSLSHASQQSTAAADVAAYRRSSAMRDSIAISHLCADSLLPYSGRARVVSPGLELSMGPLAASAQSLSTTECAIGARPFGLTLRRRHVALLQVSFLSYRQLVQGGSEAEAVVHITNKFLSAILLCVRRYNAHVVELFNDSAIMTWNGFVESPGDYVQTCAQCGCWLYQHFLHSVKEEESGAFFSLAGYAGHVVCGTTSEHSYVLHSKAVTVLRELPSLLEQRYCKYVWLGTSPPPIKQDGLPCIKWGSILAEHGVALDLYVVGAPPDDPKWDDVQQQPRVWHAPGWKIFGEESAFASEAYNASSSGVSATKEECGDAENAERLTSTVAFVENTSTTIAGSIGPPPLETFYDHNNSLYQLSNVILGESKSSVVRLALSHNGTLVAVKEITIEHGDVSAMRRRRYQREKRIIVAQGDRQQWMNEVRIMEKLHHTCVVGYISFQETHNKLRIVMEYVGGGNLLQFVAQNTKEGVRRPPVEVLLRSVLEGIDFLHRHDILHGDIKPQNVLVPDSGPCKIADFGISRRASHASTHPIEGTPFYMAPEATRGQATTASDIWSFGIMMAEVLTGHRPYDPSVSDSYLVTQFMLGGDVERRLITPLEPAAHDVFLACTQYDPAMRKTASELLQMPYFRGKTKTASGNTQQQC
ncbi:hypothetical protein ABL78_4470 [Leptomonas seymouri]|uniref:Protein kinase domain-containing protein n=1 Tax=Leptomonas seymouri TaxID=5684 RepID=A0A0N0P5H9_LEPSE|nr:hypothetical protein ABL78_4470 [Leptomonas seymouri]|eukprot:KPI86486.1 hypothetical protein ABL78_4470 [Leptomonas seymouri]